MKKLMIAYLTRIRVLHCSVGGATRIRKAYDNFFGAGAFMKAIRDQNIELSAAALKEEVRISTLIVSSACICASLCV